MTVELQSDLFKEEVRGLLESVRSPGLTGDHAELEKLRRDLPVSAALLSYKRENQELWVVFIGGTGTGKSTLFNGFCESPLSDTGVERPKTAGPVAYAHSDSPIEPGFPLEGVRISREAAPDHESLRVSGRPGELVVLDHQREAWRRLVLVDTPDLDSVEIENRRMTEALTRLSDAVVFVSSQEKYADEVPNATLSRILGWGKPSFFLLNKVNDRETGGEVTETLRGYGISLQEERVWLIPSMRPPLPVRVHADPSFHAFQERILSELLGVRSQELREEELARLAQEIHSGVDTITLLLGKEERISEGWLSRLEAIRAEVSSELTETLKMQYLQESRQYLGEKVRALFTRYDVLAGPRRFIRGILLTPFRALGFGSRSKPSLEPLHRIRKSADYTPVLRALEKMHIRVLRELSPGDPSASLFASLRAEGLLLSEKQCVQMLDRSLDELERWLEGTFEELAKGISTTKKWGIYTTSILWSILILSFEVAVGGGFGIVDAAIDSALAPFVTKGAVELFAAQEIRKIARELGARYQTGLTAPLGEQHERYRRCLQALLPSREVMARLEFLRNRI